jgi:hypothetical protein
MANELSSSGFSVSSSRMPESCLLSGRKVVRRCVPRSHSPLVSPRTKAPCIRFADTCRSGGVDLPFSHRLTASRSDWSQLTAINLPLRSAMAKPC